MSLVIWNLHVLCVKILVVVVAFTLVNNKVTELSVKDCDSCGVGK